VAIDGPPFAVEPAVVEALATLWESGHGAYLVGGGVRDALLGLPVSDWDVATDARPERILRIFPGSSYKNRFGTVLARDLEITTFRRDHRYADHRRPDSVTFSQDIFEDLARRDLTINAIAWGRRGPDAATRLVDPADGQGDLRARLVRAVGDPDRRFDEDALRLLRAVRIAARLDFTIEPVTRAAMTAHADDIGFVSEERLCNEVRRMLLAPSPSRALRLMLETGLLRTTLAELGGLAERSSDRFEGSLRTLDAAVESRPGAEHVAWAALLSELTPDVARRLLDHLRMPSRRVETVALLVAAVQVPYDPGWGDAEVRRYMSGLPPGLLDDLLGLRLARAHDEAGRARERDLARRVRSQHLVDPPLTLAQLAVDGRDLRETLGMPEGPAIGLILERLLADVIEDPALNTRLTLLTRAGLMLDELVQEGQGGAERGPIR
jgi:tRNA nucleotidyltransferase (CCA-adding enzyme)